MSECTSEQINELAKALAAAQGEMKNAPLNRVNPHFKSKYADLAAIRDATLPTLSKHGLSIVQFTEVVAAGMLLHTRLLHASGQWIDATYPIHDDKPQVVGSALTYARRYSWAEITGLAAEEDDDANAAQEHGRTKTNGNGQSADVPKIDSRFVYERLVNTMRKTKTLDAFSEWLRRNEDALNSLTQDFQLMLKEECKLHKATFPKMPLTQQAIQADKPPMPDDGIPY